MIRAYGGAFFIGGRRSGRGCLRRRQSAPCCLQASSASPAFHVHRHTWCRLRQCWIPRESEWVRERDLVSSLKRVLSEEILRVVVGSVLTRTFVWALGRIVSLKDWCVWWCGRITSDYEVTPDGATAELLPSLNVDYVVVPDSRRPYFLLQSLGLLGLLCLLCLLFEIGRT